MGRCWPATTPLPGEQEDRQTDRQSPPALRPYVEGNLDRVLHPCRCRTGLRSILLHLDLFWGSEPAPSGSGHVLPHPARLACRGDWSPGAGLESGAGGLRFESLPDAEAAHLVHWSTCRGSDPDKRGYPCGLWNLFHTVFVDAAQTPGGLAGAALQAVQWGKKGQGSGGEGQQLLVALRDFVAHFFTCKDCARHFVQASQLERAPGLPRRC